MGGDSLARPMENRLKEQTIAGRSIEARGKMTTGFPATISLKNFSASLELRGAAGFSGPDSRSLALAILQQSSQGFSPLKVSFVA